jgi:hypothetical protein
MWLAGWLPLFVFGPPTLLSVGRFWQLGLHVAKKKLKKFAI